MIVSTASSEIVVVLRRFHLLACCYKLSTCHVLAGLLEARLNSIAHHTTVTMLHSQLDLLLTAELPAAFQNLPPVLSIMDPAGAENTVIIPSILNGLATGFGQAVQSIDGWQGFTVNAAHVDTQSTKFNPWFGPLKPDIIIYDTW